MNMAEIKRLDASSSGSEALVQYMTYVFTARGGFIYIYEIRVDSG